MAQIIAVLIQSEPSDTGQNLKCPRETSESLPSATRPSAMAPSGRQPPAASPLLRKDAHGWPRGTSKSFPGGSHPILCLSGRKLPQRTSSRGWHATVSDRF